MNPYRILILASLLMLAACAPSHPTAHNNKPANNEELVFMDTSGFDSGLSEQLSGDQQAVKVDVPAAFSLNNVPPRMAKWLSEVQENGGKVKATKIVDSSDKTANHSMLGIAIDLTFAIVRGVKERATFAPAQNYDVLLKYEGDGSVKEVVFLHK